MHGKEHKCLEQKIVKVEGIVLLEFLFVYCVHLADQSAVGMVLNTALILIGRHGNALCGGDMPSYRPLLIGIVGKALFEYPIENAVCLSLSVYGKIPVMTEFVCIVPEHPCAKRVECHYPHSFTACDIGYPLSHLACRFVGKSNR